MKDCVKQNVASLKLRNDLRNKAINVKQEKDGNLLNLYWKNIAKDRAVYQIKNIILKYAEKAASEGKFSVCIIFHDLKSLGRTVDVDKDMLKEATKGVKSDGIFTNMYVEFGERLGDFKYFECISVQEGIAFYSSYKRPRDYAPGYYSESFTDTFDRDQLYVYLDFRERGGTIRDKYEDEKH